MSGRPPSSRVEDAAGHGWPAASDPLQMERNSMQSSVGWIAAAAASLLLLAAPAAAQTSAQNGYSAPAGSVQQQADPKPGGSIPLARREESSGGVLPFSGLDVVLVLAAGGVLLLLGASARRLGRPRA